MERIYKHGIRVIVICFLAGMATQGSWAAGNGSLQGSSFTSSADTAHIEEIVTFTTIIDFSGDNTDISAVSFQNVLPQGLTYVPNSYQSTNNTPIFESQENNTIIWQANLVGGNQVTISYDATIGSAVAVDTTINNTAILSGTNTPSQDNPIQLTASVTVVEEEEDDHHDVLYLPFLSIPPAVDQNCFVENAGKIIFEVESFPHTQDWVSETSAGGFLGTGYYRWDGGNFFNTPGNGVLTYVLDIQQPGEYLIRLRNRHDHPTPDQENDVFVRMDGGGWHKLFSPNLSGCGVGIWTWCSAFDFETNNLDFNPRYNLSAGQHTFNISARSANYKIDRVAFFQAGVDGTNITNQPSENCRIE